MQTDLVSILGQLAAPISILILLVIAILIWRASSKELYTLTIDFPNKSTGQIIRRGFFLNDEEAKSKLLPLTVPYFAIEEQLNITIASTKRVIYAKTKVAIVDVECIN